MDAGFAMGAVDFKRLEFVRTRAWKQLAPVLERFDALLCPTMSQVARPVDEDDFVWYEDRGDGLYHGLDMTAQFNFVEPVPGTQRPGGLERGRPADRAPDRRPPLPGRRGAPDRGRLSSGCVPGPTDAHPSRIALLPTVTANGVDLWVEQEGEGDDVLFISGLADEGACWVDQVSGLEDRYRITVFDNRGVGRSSTPDGPFEITDFAADTAALMDDLGLERAHVVGSSMGGAIAQELALGHPERVRSLVLNGTWCRGDRFLHEIFRSWKWSAQKADSIRDFLVAVNLWCFAPRIWNEGIMDEWLAAAEASPYAQSVDAFCRSADALIGHDSADRVGGDLGADARNRRRARSGAPAPLLA